MKESNFNKLVKDKLALQQFVKKKIFYIKKLDQNCYGTIGFMIKHQSPEIMYVNPVIGVFNKQLENLYCKITDYNSMETYQPTISCPLGHLMPKNGYFEWEYADGSNVDMVAAEMLDAVGKYGLPFMDKYKDASELLKCLEEGKYIIRNFREMKLPILYYLLGYKLKSKEAISSFLENHKVDFKIYLQNTGRNNPDDERYFSFAEKFEQVLSCEG